MKPEKLLKFSIIYSILAFILILILGQIIDTITPEPLKPFIGILFLALIFCFLPRVVEGIVE